jgi:hypothetical protein
MPDVRINCIVGLIILVRPVRRRISFDPHLALILCLTAAAVIDTLTTSLNALAADEALAETH